MKFFLVVGLLGTLTWTGIWFSRDQRAQRLFDQGEFSQAAETYEDPMHSGVAWFKAGEWEKAEQAFARDGSSIAEYNRGNCLVMQGKYEEAVRRYDRALELDSTMDSAKVNRDVALIRAERNKSEGGDMGDQKLGADEIVFDKKNDKGQETQLEESQPVSDESMQAVWLRRVQT